MFLQPKKFKYNKTRKGKLQKLNFKNDKVQFGEIGLKAVVSGTITARQIESARKAIVRKIKSKEKFGFVFSLIYLLLQNLLNQEWVKVKELFLIGLLELVEAPLYLRYVEFLLI